MHRYIEPQELRQWILDGEELAILDAREEAAFGESHLFWAVSCPLSRMETVSRLVLPQALTRIVCVDDGSGSAESLASFLEGAGWETIRVLRGGTRAWKDAGFVLFSGINVPSKAFGEWVEHHYGTPNVEAATLNGWLAQGRSLRIVDSRPFEEFNRMSIPGGTNVPGGELVYRIGDIAPDPDTVIVVNCAGRTRSIMGAESLRRAGIPNEIYALKNGTMGWSLAGLELSHGETARFNPDAPRSWALALERATRFAEQSGVTVITESDLDRLENDHGKTLYVLDVRDPAEFSQGHYVGSRNAPGGQLVQDTDRWIAVRNAQVVLIDDQGVRSRMTGAWLRQMGHKNVMVLDGVPFGRSRPQSGSRPRVETPQPPSVDAAALAKEIEAGGVVILDVAYSIEYRAGHIPGALWGLRRQLSRLEPRLRGARMLVLTSPDDELARFAYEEACGLTSGRVVVLAGGTRAWAAAGHALARTPNTPTDSECIDFYLRPFERNERVEEAMRAYITWELDLVNEIERDGTIFFGVDSLRPG